eukprot:scaffold408_cov347-Pavlova_lutheri.AAC.21
MEPESRSHQIGGMETHRLAKLLDESEDEHDMGWEDAFVRAGKEGPTDQEGRIRTLQDRAVDARTRLGVALQQMAEYAVERADECKALHQWMERLEREGKQGERDTKRELLDKVKEMALEAEGFAQQCKNDARKEMQTKREENARGDVDMDETITPDVENGTVEDGTGECTTPAGTRMEQDNPKPDASEASDEMKERCKYIPLRLTLRERKMLRLLEAALSVSEYTDKVDILSYRSRMGRIHAQIKEICAILSGLVVASDYRAGQNLIANKEFSDNASFFQDVFEVGRRHKIMNPEKMRSDYGKLVYLLQDSTAVELQELLQFKCVQPLKTVYALLEEKEGLALLEDPLVEVATAEVKPGGRPRSHVQKAIKVKEAAREKLAKAYGKGELTPEEVRYCLYSIGDNNSYLYFNRDPVDKMIEYLTKYFDPQQTKEPKYSLSIVGGKEGARLTHNHARQYTYVLQSLTLWREISHDMFKLWCLAEGDLLRENNSYRLTDTGQGLNRVQSAPAVSRAIHQILRRSQQKLGSWVGSSVIHLGDHNVPNALMFIDKYTQVPRILNPVVLVLEQIPVVARQEGLQEYLDANFGGIDGAIKEILTDFFRHAFDGSGADNFFDAGSCIDGRLTSAWNWCSKIEKKRYYPVFKLAGFVGFDGGTAWARGSRQCVLRGIARRLKLMSLLLFWLRFRCTVISCWVA